nr:hypothetical protein mPipKuh1_001886 [Pipistrellus kuhlii]
MAAQKRKAPGAPGTPERKRRKVKKAAAAAAAPGSSETRPEDGASSDTDSELSPEEKRVLERKRKKERKKEERKRLREAAATGTAPAQPRPAKPSGAQLALDYLSGWARKHQGWRFQKTRQTWLLVHMFDSDQVPDQHFPTLLAYLEGLRGRARELTVQKAEALMRQLDEAGAAPDHALLERSRRARQVLQLLS